MDILQTYFLELETPNRLYFKVEIDETTSTTIKKHIPAKIEKEKVESVISKLSVD